MKTVKQIEEWLRRKPAERTRLNHKIHRAFLQTHRYVVDFAEDFNTEGWQQFDTSQDAHYFGFWVNPVKLITLTYAEGDWSLVVCENIEQYNKEIQSAIDFYEEGFIAITYGDEGRTVYRQDRTKFLIA